MYTELENSKIDKTKEAFKDFPDFLDGQIFIKFDNGFITQKDEQVDNKIIILQQIKDLEAQQTTRLLREATLGVEFAVNKLKDIDAQIATLRQELSAMQ